MKPLRIAPRLPEDNNVWLFNGRRSDALHSALWTQSHAADRRDAELMSEAVQLLRCPIWSKRFASPPGGRMLDQMTMAREWVGL